MTAGTVVAPLILTPIGPGPRRGEDLHQVSAIPDGALAWDASGVLTYVGPARGLPTATPVSRVPGVILPGFVDAHTHLPFFGWRSDEFQSRLAGRSYRDVHGQGGGIARSARLLADASDEQVMAFCLPLALQMATHGTTAFEMKTGYGLSVEAELRQARLARRLAGEIPQTTSVTLLACHAVPGGSSRSEWVEEACTELLPAAAGEHLVDAVDVYVEDIAFSVEDFARVARAAGDLGLEVRCHADQLGASGAAEAAVEAGARNADHLNHLSDRGVAALGRGTTAAGLLPVADWVTGERPPPVADLLKAGAAILLATDFNPGTSPCLSMPEVMAAAASLYALPFESSLTAATINAAWALGIDDAVGSLEPGKRADFVVLDTDDPGMIPYRPGHNPVAQTWIGGELVWGATA